MPIPEGGESQTLDPRQKRCLDLGMSNIPNKEDFLACLAAFEKKNIKKISKRKPHGVHKKQYLDYAAGFVDACIIVRKCINRRAYSNDYNYAVKQLQEELVKIVNEK